MRAVGRPHASAPGHASAAAPRCRRGRTLAAPPRRHAPPRSPPHPRLPPAHAASPHPFYGGGGRSGDDGEDEATGASDGDAASTSGSEAPDVAAGAARRALAGAGGGGPPVGAEYGEGFTHFRPSAAGTLEPTHLDVDTLNDKLAPSGAARHRIALRPDEAHGAVFVFEGVVADTEAAAAAAWARVAAASGRPPPSIAARPALLAVRPERAVTDVLHWTRDWGEARALAADVAGAYLEEVSALAAARPGVARWWAALAGARVPVAVVSELDRATVATLLARFGLVGGGDGGCGDAAASPPPPFTSVSVVAAEDGAETRAQALLAAALKLGRPPAACVAFGGDPATVAAAHNASMAAVAVVSARHPAYALSEADLKVGDLSELTVQNVRRLFAGRGEGFMDLAKERASSSGDGGGGGGGGSSGSASTRRLWADRPRGAAVDER